jgi:hypothetical protein
MFLAALELKKCVGGADYRGGVYARRQWHNQVTIHSGRWDLIERDNF